MGSLKLYCANCGEEYVFNGNYLYCSVACRGAGSRKLSYSQVNEIQQMITDGVPYTEIQKKYDVTEIALNGFIQRYNIKCPDRRNRAILLCQQNEALIKELLGRGHKKSKIAREIGVSVTSLSKYLDKHEIVKIICKPKSVKPEEKVLDLSGLMKKCQRFASK